MHFAGAIAPIAGLLFSGVVPKALTFAPSAPHKGRGVDDFVDDEVEDCQHPNEKDDSDK